MKKQNARIKSCILVCAHGKKGKKGTCAGSGSSKLAKLLKNEVDKRSLKKVVKVRKTDCLGQCSKGPNVVIFPGGSFYSHVTRTSACTIVDELVALLDKDS